MLVLNSDEVTIEKTEKEVYTFLSNMDNTGKLMPEQIINWKGDNDTCSYTIKGMADVSMNVAQRDPNSILVKSSGEKPFAFQLKYTVSPAENGSKLSIEFEGDVNPFMKMMVEKPMGNLINYMVRKAAKVI